MPSSIHNDLLSFAELVVSTSCPAMTAFTLRPPLQVPPQRGKITPQRRTDTVGRLAGYHQNTAVSGPQQAPTNLHSHGVPPSCDH